MNPKSENFLTKGLRSNYFLILAILFLVNACTKENSSSVVNEVVSNEEEVSTDTPIDETFNADVNQDGTLNILLLGPSKSIKSNVAAFSLPSVAEELTVILTEDEKVTTMVNVMYQ